MYYICAISSANNTTIMNEELDFEDYPILHLHMMIDDYEELCREANKCYYSDTAKTEYESRDEYYFDIDPQGRFSFCFTD